MSIAEITYEILKDFHHGDADIPQDIHNSCKQLFDEIILHWNTIEDIDFERLNDDVILYMFENFMELSLSLVDGTCLTVENFARLLNTYKSRATKHLL